HDPVGDELAFAGAAEMAIEALAGADTRIFERDEAARDIVGMGAAHRIMAVQPARGGTVAAFAADAVRGLEADAARPGRGGMAAEAGRRRAWVADAEPLADRLRARIAQHIP